MNLAIDPEQALARTVLLIRSDVYPNLDDAIIVKTLTGTRVRLRSDAANLATSAGQTALVSTAIMCAQLGAELLLDFPPTPMLTPQPPLKGPELRDAVLDAAADMITPARMGDEGDVTIVLGDTPLRHGAPNTLRLSGGDWQCTLEPGSQPGHRWHGDLPFGPAYAGVAAAAEVFRYILKNLGTVTNQTPLPEQPLDLGKAVTLRLTSIPPSTQIGVVDVISAGALSTAALYLLLRIPSLRGRLHVIDDDMASVSNLNRYPLLRRENLGRPKVEVLADFGGDRLAIHPISRRFDDRSVADLLPLADKVLVGVDDIPSRWLVQSHAYGWLGVAATSHFEAVVSEHTPDSPCVACLHPHDDEGGPGEIPTVSFVSAFAGFSVAYRLLRTATRSRHEMADVAYPFNLSAPFAVHRFPLAARSDCRLSCTASR